MIKYKKILTVLIITCFGFCLYGCGTNYCSYGGCMKKVDHDGGRCSTHQGLKNNPYYGLSAYLID